MGATELGKAVGIAPSAWIRDVPITGEALMDEPELADHPLYPFDPTKEYRVRESWKGRELIGEWEAPQ